MAAAVSSSSALAVVAGSASATAYTLDPNDAFIAVMGVTGSGKSTFISKCCEAAVGIIGDSLSSCTQECQAYKFKHKDRTVHLIDTPGFDDTKKSDTDVLKDIAGWLLKAYQQDIRLSGMVYLHSISETRMKGSHMTNLRMFQKLAGLENMGHVVLTTTMWDKTPEDIGKNREIELLSTDDFWGAMVKKGSEVRRFKNDKNSALNIVGRLVEKHDKLLAETHEKLLLDLQREMGENHKDLDQTSAGKALNVEINAQKEQYEKRLKEQEDEMKTAIKENDMKYAQELLDAQDKINKDMQRLEDNQEELKISNQQLLKEKDEQIRKANEQMEKLKMVHEDEIGKIRLQNQQNEQEVVADAVDLVALMGQQFSNLTAEQERQLQAALRAQQAQQAQHQSPPPPYDPYQPPSPANQHSRPQHDYSGVPAAAFPPQNFPNPQQFHQQQFPQQQFPPQQQFQQPMFQQPMPQPMPQQMPQQGSDGSWLAGAAGGAAMASVVAGGLPFVCTIM